MSGHSLVLVLLFLLRMKASCFSQFFYVLLPQAPEGRPIKSLHQSKLVPVPGVENSWHYVLKSLNKGREQVCLGVGGGKSLTFISVKLVQQVDMCHPQNKPVF